MRTLLPRWEGAALGRRGLYDQQHSCSVGAPLRVPCIASPLLFSCIPVSTSFALPLFPPAARPPPPPTRGPGDVIGDCKVQFLDEIYQVEKPGSRALSAADGQFKRT